MISIKKLSLVLSFFLFIMLSKSAIAQNQPVFTGAKATLKHYKALYVLNSGDDKKISGTLRNIKNASEDPPFKG